jgi:hypothetical protein
VYEQKGQRDQAVQHDLSALGERRPPIDTKSLLAVYQQQGWQAYWAARSRVFLSTAAEPCTGHEIGVDDVRVNELDHAFESFNHAIDQHCFYMALIRVDPLLDPVRHDPRYAALLTRIHQ